MSGVPNGLGAEHRAHDRHSEGGADLAGRGVGRTGHARLLPRHVGEDDIDQLRAGESVADPEQEEAGYQADQGDPRGYGQGHGHQARRLEGQSEADDDVGRPVAGEASAQLCARR